MHLALLVLRTHHEKLWDIIEQNFHIFRDIMCTIQTNLVENLMTSCNVLQLAIQILYLYRICLAMFDITYHSVICTFDFAL